jgi:hypothetical protein
MVTVFWYREGEGKIVSVHAMKADGEGIYSSTP